MMRSLGHALARLALALGTVSTLSGCWLLFPEQEEPPPPYVGGGARPAPSTPSIDGSTDRAPHITSIDIPAFPPLSAASEIVVECEDTDGLFELTSMFRDPATFKLSGKQQSVTIRGDKLGEGYGLLQLRLSNLRGNRSERAVEHLLVDMTPPELEIESSIVNASSELALWVRDEWVLGFVEVSFRGKTVRHEFPKAYPSSLGTSWDESRVSFPATEFEEGAASVIVVIGDAAGNQALREIPFEIDATAPTTTLTAPTAGQHVGGDLDIDVSGRDGNNQRPVSIDLFVNGSLIGSVLGPNGSLSVDTTGLPRGVTVVEAIAIDAAGNQSPPALVEVILD